MEAFPPEGSIYTTEVYAIVLALQIVKGCKTNCVVFSDVGEIECDPIRDVASKRKHNVKKTMFKKNIDQKQHCFLFISS